ncbi:MAG: extracellular solute-binding protein [Pseudomonadota bacterium]
MSKLSLFLFIGVTFALVFPAAHGNELNIYTSRHYDTDQKLYDAFTQRTGVKVNVVEGGGGGLIERLQAEGSRSPADIFITADAGRLWRADDAGLLAPHNSQVIEDRVPTSLRTENWSGFSRRARVIYYNKEMGPPAGLNDYEDLATFDGTICVRTSSNIYNLSLTASMIDAHGVPQTEQWARGLVQRLAREPSGNDRAQIKGVAAGLCTVAIANTYYWAHMMQSADPDEASAAQMVGVIFPNQSGRGTHVNISGGGILANAPNADNAKLFLEFLVSDEAQTMFAQANNEYPISPDVPATGIITQLGPFKADPIDISLYGENQAEAVRLTDRAGWK